MGLDAKKPVEAFERWRVGDLIDHRYEVYRILKGGMGVVYICIEKETNEPVAVKTFQDKYLSDENARKRFVREAETWTRLEKHKNIVSAFFIEAFSGKPYIFLEYVPSSQDGKATLRDYVCLGLDLTRALNLAVQFCDGMVYATEKIDGLVHRDIKPDNIMITPDGVVKVTDFGLVKADTEHVKENFLQTSGDEPVSSDVSFSRSGAVMGTPPYMSPEQVLGRQVDTRSDIYSFGAVLYEMLTGRFIFPAKTTKEFFHHHINTVPENPQFINPKIPVTLDGLIMKCLVKRPEDRYQSFKELRKKLDDIYFEVSDQRVPVHIGPPPEAWELSNKGLSLVELGHLDEGIATLKQAIELDPNDRKAHGHLGNAYYKKGWWDQAIAEHKRALELDPNNAWDHVNLGLAYYETGRLDEAIAEYKRAIGLDPNVTSTHTKLGSAYYKKGWNDQAITEHKRAIELDPNDRWAHYNLGNAYHRIGRLDQAITEYQLAIEIDPNLMQAQFNVAATYYETKRFDLAWKHVRIAEKMAGPTQKIGQLITALREVSREPLLP